MPDQTEKSIRLVVFDWAGTTVDFGSCAPAAAFVEVFAQHGVQVSADEARQPMGLNKRDHLVAMLSDPAVAERWKTTNGKPWTQQDVDRMYAAFAPIQLRTIEQHADLTPGLLGVVSELRSRGIQIGATTGYFHEAAAAVALRAADSGYKPDVSICADDVPAGRPAPWMIYRVMERLNVYPARLVVKVGDTTADVKAGLAAGCWSIGVCDSSSLVGLTKARFDELSTSERNAKLNRAAAVFREAGAHAVVHTLSELPSAIDELANQVP